MRALASLPLRAAVRLRRAVACERDLGRPTVIVGNRALGGRGKTPVAAALARALRDAGWRPGLVATGYPNVSAHAAPARLEATGPAPAPWLVPLSGPDRVAPAWALAPRHGDEACWLAATCPGVPVAVHPVRDRAAALLRGCDVLVLDDGAQAPLRRDVEVLLAHRDDARALVREGAGALGRADLVAWWGDDLRRGCEALVGLDGRPAEPRGPITVAAAVGDPASVEQLAGELGLRLSGRLRLRDHRGPGAARRRLLRPRAWLVTGKDAVGWAARTPLPGDTLVLRQRLIGLEPIVRDVLQQLGPPGGRS